MILTADSLNRIQEMHRMAGKGASTEEALLMKLLENDYDPDEYDKLMASAFGDEYYSKGSGAMAENEEDVLDPDLHQV